MTCININDIYIIMMILLLYDISLVLHHTLYIVFIMILSIIIIVTPTIDLVTLDLKLQRCVYNYNFYSTII